MGFGVYGNPRNPNAPKPPLTAALNCAIVSALTTVPPERGGTHHIAHQRDKRNIALCRTRHCNPHLSHDTTDEFRRSHGYVPSILKSLHPTAHRMPPIWPVSPRPVKVASDTRTHINIRCPPTISRQGQPSRIVDPSSTQPNPLFRHPKPCIRRSVLVLKSLSMMRNARSIIKRARVVNPHTTSQRNAAPRA